MGVHLIANIDDFLIPAESKQITKSHAYVPSAGCTTGFRINHQISILESAEVMGFLSMTTDVVHMELRLPVQKT